MDFDQAFEKLLGLEGDYSNHPADPGAYPNACAMCSIV